MTSGKQFKWITYDAELENASECALREAAESIRASTSTSAGIRFLNHEGPNEKSEEFRRTVRMHVMRDYRARMREKDAATLGSSPGSNRSTTPRASSKSPPRTQKKKPTSLQLPNRKQQKLRLSRKGIDSQPASAATSPIPSPLPSPAFYDYSPLPSPGFPPPYHPSQSPGLANIPQIVYNTPSLATGGVPGTDIGYCSEDSEGAWSQAHSYVHSPAASCGNLSLPGTPSAYNTHFSVPVVSPSPERYAIHNIDQFMVPPSDPPEARELLEHYLNCCDRLYPYDNDFNPIKQLFLPLASRNLAILYGIMAVSAVHLANITGGPKMDALYYRQKAIELLNVNKEILAAISPTQQGHDRSTVQEALVAAFFIGSFDVSPSTETYSDVQSSILPERIELTVVKYVDCGIANLQEWMAGAEPLDICGGQDMLGLDGLLFRIFSWYLSRPSFPVLSGFVLTFCRTDIIGSTLTLTKPKLPIAFFDEDSGIAREWPTCHFWSCPNSLLRIIAEIATLASELLHEGGPGITVAAADIESRLLGWNGATEPRPMYGDDWVSGFETFRLAALTCLYLLPMQLPRTDLRVQSTVASACQILENLGEYSQVEKPIVWVYFMIGSGAASEEHRQIIRNRMENAGARTGVGAWDGALKMLRVMWDAGDTLWNTLLVAEKHGVSFQFV
ncbi:hypothetical protein EX30DRAFT_256144 [Ascodesmis nigricans]|uniref:Transcription factor domain-containing protein n=1 Tax=Ascodesmis nigricans TaxID=341454 RepID=A0A4S2MHJ8_9PEZI|nr:hypothetical protein EX30DRAFT_256144 [Ascodesmis nigricans]